MKKLAELSVFFPLYNEEKNVKELVRRADEVISGLSEEYEILLINDGSTDNTREIAESMVEKYPRVRVISQENRGYGGALKRGFNEAKYDWIFYSDGDLQFDLSELGDFLPFTGEYDLIIGYRKKRAEGFKRNLITRLLKIWNKIFFNFPFKIKDIDCAFKLLKKDSLEKILPLQTEGGLISTEMLLKAKKEGLKIKQLPVSHFQRKHGASTGDSVKVIKKAVIETWQLLQLFPKRKKLLLITAFWFLVLAVLFPVTLSINYLQNDEYTNFRLVNNFLDGNFALDPYLGATFYVQGFLGAAFSFLFGVGALPVLTLIISVAGIYIFNLILVRFFSLRTLTSILISIIMFLNPWYLYSSWGFMTENYFIFFFLLSLYFIFTFRKLSGKKSFILANIFIWLSYGVRQFGIFTALAFALALLRKKGWQYFAAQMLLTLSLLFFHFYLFPQTPQMYDNRLLFSNLFLFDRTFTIVLIIGTYLGVFLLPFLPAFFKKKEFKRRQWLIVILLTPLLIFLAGKKFEPEEATFLVRTREGDTYRENISTEFPYLKNIFTRKGFYEDNLPGDKYNFPGYFDLFNFMGLAGKVVFLGLIVYAFLNLRKIEKFSLWYSLIFVGVMVVSPRIFDRYLLPIVFTAVIMFLPLLNFGKTAKLFLAGTALFWLFLGYQFTADMIIVNRYIWSQAEKIHKETGTAKNKISADHSWRQLYPAGSKDRIYHFTYDNFGKAQRSDNYELLGRHKIDYPLNFYRDSYIYLYKNWGAVED